MCCALVSYVLLNVYMLQSEVNWFLYCSAYTGLFLYLVFNSHAAQSDSDTEWKCFQKLYFASRRGLETRQKRALSSAVGVNVSMRISGGVHVNYNARFGSPSYF